MQGHVERLLQVRVADHGPPEHPRHEDQVPRAGDRRELRRPLHEAEDDRLEDAHTVLPSENGRLMLAADGRRNGEGARPARDRRARARRWRAWRTPTRTRGAPRPSGRRAAPARSLPTIGVVAPPKEAPPPARSTASTSIASPATSVWAPPPPKVAITSTRSPGFTPTAEATGTSTARIPAGTTEAVGPDRAPASRSSVTTSPAAMSATAIRPGRAGHVAHRARRREPGRQRHHLEGGLGEHGAARHVRRRRRRPRPVGLRPAGRRRAGARTPASRRPRPARRRRRRRAGRRTIAAASDGTPSAGP